MQGVHNGKGNYSSKQLDGQTGDENGNMGREIILILFIVSFHA
jgi:hypothetical protein